MRKVFFIVLMLLPVSMYAQKEGQKLIDFRLRKLRAMKEDTNKVKALNDLSVNYASINTNEGIKYGFLGLNLAEKLGWENGIALLNNSLGRNYLSKADYGKALEYFNRSLKIYEAQNDKSGIAASLRNIGNVGVTQGNFAKALEHYQEALKINEELEDKRSIAQDLGNIGTVYQNQSNYAVALDYHLKALKMNEELGDKRGVANNFSIIGMVYIGRGDYPLALENYNKALKIYEGLGDKSGIALNLKNVGNGYLCLHDYPKALEYYGSSMAVYEELGDKSGIARNLGNMGNVYQEQYHYAKALDYLLKASKMNEELGEKYPMANNIGSIGVVYLTIAKGSASSQADKMANLYNAVEYLEKAVAIDEEIGNLHEIQHFSFYLSEAQELLGNYVAALESYEQCQAAKDSIFSAENSLKIAQLGEKQQAELKQKQIEMQQLKIDAAKHQRYYYIIGFVMLAMVTTGLFRRYLRMRKTKWKLEQKNRIIALEKEKADMLRMRAETSEQFKQQFLTNMSHEIRTPMNAVNGMTDLLLDKNPRPDQLHYLQVISRSSDILLRIINDILDLSKIESGKLELETIDFSLRDTVLQVTEMLSFRAEEKGLRLETHIDDAIPAVLIGDPFRLKQILMNLGGNGIKFTEKGNVEIRVKYAATVGGRISLLFQVADTGIGIPADKLQHLFDSHKQAQNTDSRTYGGTVLGLSISKKLVEIQGGNIGVESTVGHGTTFSFELSYTEGSSERLQDRTQDERKVDSSVLKGLRVLLVDDNDYNRMVASETLLSKVDVFIDEAANGLEAIRLLEQNDYDVVLMDVQMPIMSGLDATRHIRRQMPSPKNKIPIVALTANLLRSDVDMCTDAGMNTCVPKPFKAAQIISALADVTGRKNASVN